MAGDENLGGPLGEVEVDGEEGDEQSGQVALVHEDALEGSHRRHHRRIGDRERAPRGAQRHPNRSFIRSVPADVADDEPRAPLVQLHEIEEVAAEQRAAAAGPVQRDDRDR